MIDFHTHTYLSDGQIGPSELIRRAKAAGYKAVGLSDHADFSTIRSIVPAVVEVCARESEAGDIEAVPGIEITHARPEHIAELADIARSLGAKYVAVHGETLVEPVLAGTNRAAIEAGCDILAHPGLISEEDALLAEKRGVSLEITSKAGHCYTNGYVAKAALKAGAAMIFGTDAHGPEQLASEKLAREVLLGAGLGEAEAELVLGGNAEALLEKFMSRG